MSAGFLFDSNAGETAESLAKKRKVIEALLAKGGGGGGARAPQDIGDGIYAIGQAIGQRRQMAELAAAEKKLGAEGDSVFGKGLAAALGGGGEAGPVADMAPAGGASVPAFAQGGAGPADEPPPQIKALIDQHVPEADRQYVTRLFGKESTFDPSAVSPTGATGLGQFTRGTGTEYGLVGPGFDRRADPVANVQATVALTNDNREKLRSALGREPTYGELALAHQQGSAGAINLLSGKGVDPNNLRVNNVDPSSSPQAAAQKIMRFYNMPGKQAQLPPPPRSWEIGSPADIPPMNAAAAQGVMPPPEEPPIQMAQAPGTADQMAALAPPMPVMPPAGPMQAPGPLPTFGQRFPGNPDGQFVPPEALAAGVGGPLPAMAGPGAPQLPLPPPVGPQAAAVPPLPPPVSVGAPPAAPIPMVAQALAAAQQAPQPQMPMDGRPEGQINVAQALADAQARGQGAPQGPGMAQASNPIAGVAQALGLAPSPGGASPQAALAGPAGQGAAPAQGGNRILELARYAAHPALSPERRVVVNALLQRELARQDKREEWGRGDRIRGEDRRNVEGDRTITYGREDARRTEDQTRADRDRELDVRAKAATAKKAEAELLTGGPLPEARRTWESIKADNDKVGKPTKSFEDWLPEYKRAGAQNINVGGGSDKQIFDAFEKSADEARTAATGLTGLREARAAMKGGAFTGIGADARLNFQKVVAFFGGDTSKVENTETFRSVMAPQVAAMIKATVGTTNISNTDREFAKEAAAGTITLDEASINRVMNIMERASLSRIDLHKSKLDKVYPEKDGKFERERALFGVDHPPELSAAAPATPSGATTGTGIKWKVLP